MFTLKEIVFLILLFPLLVSASMAVSEAKERNGIAALWAFGAIIDLIVMIVIFWS